MTRDLYQDQDDNYREIDEDKDNTSDSRETCPKSEEVTAVTAAGVTGHSDRCVVNWWYA